MEFRIMGKSLITGQTLETTVDVRDEAAARAHAESMRLQHISIAPVEKAPAEPAQPRRKRILAGAIVWGVAVIAAAGAVAALMWTDGSGGLDFRRYMPERPTSALFINFDRIRDTDAFRDIEPTLRRAAPLWAGLTLTTGDVAQALAAADEAGEYWVIRTRADMPLEEIVLRKRQHLRCEGRLAIKADGGGGTMLIVRLGAKTFCILEGADKDLEARFKTLAGRFDSEGERKLEGDVAKAMDEVGGRDVVLIANPARPRANRPRFIAVGVDVQRDIDVKARLDFADEKAAGEYVANLESQKKAGEGAEASVESTLLAGLRPGQSGASVVMKGVWAYGEIHKLTDAKPDRFIGAIERAWR